MIRAADVTSAFRHLTVEPILLMMCFGLSICFTLFRPSLVVKICIQLAAERFPGEPDRCHALHTYEKSFYQEVERRSANLQTWITVGTTITPLIATFILSAWGDRVGRKINILLGIAGAMCLGTMQIIVIAIPESPLWIIPVVYIGVGCTGGLSAFQTSCTQYVADTVKDKRTLGVRLTFIMVSFLVGFSMGSLLASYLVRVVPVPMAMMIGQCIATPAFAYTLIFIKQKPPMSHTHNQISNQSTDSGDSSTSSTSESDLVKKPGEPEPSFFKYITGLLVDIWRTFTKPRPGKRRMYLWLSAIAYFSVSFSSDGSEGLNATYMTTPPLTFTTEKYPQYMAYAGAAVSVGSLAGGFVMKKLGTPDTIVMIISMISTAFTPLTFALASKDWIVYISPAVGCLSMLVIGTYQSFLVNLVDTDEVGKIIAGQAFSGRIADLISGIIMSQLYRATVDSCRGAAYFASFGLCIISTFMLIGIHFGTRDIVAAVHAEESVRKRQRKNFTEPEVSVINVAENEIVKNV